MKTISQLLAFSKGDVLLTFPTQGIIRNFHMAKCNVKLGELFTVFFGDEEWKNIASNSDSIVEYYKGKLSRTNGLRRSVDSLPVMDELNHRLCFNFCHWLKRDA